jgi:hypothetical protein
VSTFLLSVVDIRNECSCDGEIVMVIAMAVVVVAVVKDD